jgi:hypothetical protein
MKFLTTALVAPCWGDGRDLGVAVSDLMLPGLFTVRRVVAGFWLVHRFQVFLSPGIADMELYLKFR